MRTYAWFKTLNSLKKNSLQKCCRSYMSTKSKEDLMARIQKHNISTVTMV